MLKKDVLKYYGTVRALADALGYSPQAVYKWGRTIPLTAQYRLEVVSGGKFRAKREAA